MSRPSIILLMFVSLAACVKDGSNTNEADLLLDAALLSRVQAEEAAKFQIDFRNATASSIYIGAGPFSGIGSNCATNFFEVSGTTSLAAGKTAVQIARNAGSYVVQWTTTGTTKTCSASAAYRAGYEYHVTIPSTGSPTVEEAQCRDCMSQTETVLLLYAIRGKP